jgi:hypothetical protein
MRRHNQEFPVWRGSWQVETQLPDIVQASPEDWARIRVGDLYALLDKLTTMQSGLMSVWDPDATIHPLTDHRRRQARDSLHAAIADIVAWIDRWQSVGKPVP